MTERSDLDRRLRAVERALTDGDHDVAGLRDRAALVERLDALETRIDDLESRTADLDAATQAVRGYVGNVRAVNDDVEDRADAAIAAVERLEARLDGNERAGGTHRTPDHSKRPTATRSIVDEGQRDQRYGIEMPVPDERDDEQLDESGDGERSVIERVREAL